MTGYPVCVSHSRAVRILLLAQTLQLADTEGWEEKRVKICFLRVAPMCLFYGLFGMPCEDSEICQLHMHGEQAQLLKSIQCRSAAPSS
jgi:hypothetical protein